MCAVYSGTLQFSSINFWDFFSPLVTFIVSYIPACLWYRKQRNFGRRYSKDKEWTSGAQIWKKSMKTKKATSIIRRHTLIYSARDSYKRKKLWNCSFLPALSSQSNCIFGQVNGGNGCVWIILCTSSE